MRALYKLLLGEQILSKSWRIFVQAPLWILWLIGLASGGFKLTINLNEYLVPFMPFLKEINVDLSTLMGWCFYMIIFVVLASATNCSHSFIEDWETKKYLGLNDPNSDWDEID